MAAKRKHKLKERQTRHSTMVSSITKRNFDSAAILVHTARLLLAVCLVLGIFQLQIMPVQSQRNSIRGKYERQRDSNKIGSYNSGRPSNENSNESPAVPSNNSNIGSKIPNLVLVPQCNPNDPNSYYNAYETAEDSIADCDQYLQYCDKIYSNLSFSSFSSFVYPRDFYETVGLLYGRCFRSCSEHLGGSRSIGSAEQFCSMPKPSQDYAASLSQDSKNYCSLYTDSSEAWTDEMMTQEAEVLLAMNAKRKESSGTVCNRRTSNTETITTFFPMSSPAVVNPELSCAARIQAQNIVLASLENERFPSNLHTACPSSLSLVTMSSAPICEGFSTRMVKAGYPYQSQGFGVVNEVTAAGYNSAQAVVNGWLASTSGHCSAIVKQESPFVPTEVGIGYFEYGGMTGHVMIVAQRQS